jgi:hypothetical protein
MIWNGVCRGASPRKSSHDIWIQLMRLASEKKFFQSGFELLRFALVLVGICHFRPLASGTVLLRNLTDLPAELSGRPPDCEYSWRIHRHCCSMATQGENLLRAFPSIRPESSAAVRRSPSVLDYLMESGRCSRSRRNRAAHELDRRTARKTASTSPASAPASTRNRDGQVCPGYAPPPAGAPPGYVGGPPAAAAAPPAYAGGPPAVDPVAFCMQRFRSYDPKTGTYIGNDGQRHSCP